MASEHPEVLIGTSGWLFLNEGNNLSYSYLTGAAPVSEKVGNIWRSTIERRLRFEVPVAHLICPEKLAVFPDKYQGASLDENRLSLQLCSYDSVIYPDENLRQLVDDVETYPRTDTHFNEAGALIFAERVLSIFGLEWRFDARWRSHETVGDLGGKLETCPIGKSIALSNRWPVEFFDNGLKNRGRVCLYKNGKASHNRLLVFGDSFSGQNLNYILSGAFKELLFVHSLSADLSVVEKFNPDFILFELAERFLRVPPSDGISLASLLLPKLNTSERDALLAWRNNVDNPTWQYMDWNIFDLTGGVA